MKTVLLSLAGCLLLITSATVMANCGSGSAIACGGPGPSGSGAGMCDPVKSDCQCSDPLCHKPMYTNCISRAYCCEAFGNIGAR